MRVFSCRNVHDALPTVIAALQEEGIERESRNGPVLMFPTPVTTVYQKPLERVLYYPERDANPYFHLFESLWMLGGRNDCAFPCIFVKNFDQYSDDGETFHAAYGHRWRRHFGLDQLEIIVEMLKKDPNDRRAILSMWDANVDGLGRVSKDFPCNMQAMFSIDHENKLNMLVSNRSNDIILGAYGANAVHFSYLLEFMAAAIGVEVGKYYQMSNNFHAYKANLSKGSVAIARPNPYEEAGLVHVPLVNTNMDIWHQDLMMFLTEGPIVGFRDKFFRRVATPMWNSHKAYRQLENPKRFEAAKEILGQCQDTAWAAAAFQWLERREEALLKKQRKERAQDDGVNHDTAA